MKKFKQNEEPLNTPTRSILAMNLKKLRAIRGLSQEMLGFEAGLHRTFVGHVERGARNISLDNLEKLSEALGVECWELLKKGE